MHTNFQSYRGGKYPESSISFQEYISVLKCIFFCLIFDNIDMLLKTPTQLLAMKLEFCRALYSSHFYDRCTVLPHFASALISGS